MASAALLAAACTPAAAPSPTAPPGQAAASAPAPTSAPAAGAAANPQAKATAPAARPAASPAAETSYDEQAVADFYQGKTIRFIVAVSAGGGFDTVARLMVRYLRQYVPGNPTLIVENMPGAGTILAANQAYSSLPKDGTVLVNFSENLPLLEALDKEGIEFESERYQWIGSSGRSATVLVARKDSGVNSIQDLMAGKELIVGTTGPGGSSHDPHAAVRATLAPGIKIVPNYGGTSDIRLALERSEVTGAGWSWDSLQVTAKTWFESDPPLVTPLVQMGNQPIDHPWLEGVPAAETLAKNDEDRAVLQAVHAPQLMSRPWAMAPEVPADRVAALRAAMARAFADPELLADAKKANLDVVFTPGEEVAKIVHDTLSMSPSLKARLKEVLR